MTTPDRGPEADEEPPPFDALAPEPDGFPRAFGRGPAGGGENSDDDDGDEGGYDAEAGGGWDSGFGDAGPGNADSGD